MAMKTILLILTALLLLSCSTDEFNQFYSGDENKGLTARTQDKIDDRLIGEYIPYSIDYPGTVKITKDRLEYIGGVLEFKNYTTISVIDCSFDIYLPDGTILKIQDRRKLGLIILCIQYPDNKIQNIGIYKPYEEEAPEVINQ